MRASRGGFFAISLGLVAGCPSTSTFQDQVDPGCLEPGWIGAAAEAIETEPDTFEAVMGEVLLHVPLQDGDWADDYGDARFYGPAVLLGLGQELESPCLLAFADATLEGNRALIRRGQWCLLSFWQELPEHVMAAYGLIEAYHHEPKAEDLRLIDLTLDRVDSALELFGLYFDQLPDSEAEMYGPTTLTAGLAVLNLRYAVQVGGPRGPEREDFGRRVIQAVDDRAYDAEHGMYRFAEGTDELYLYPNTMMIIANCLAHQATGEARYLERARTTFSAVQPLKDVVRGGYRSPYSAALAGAETEDYTTLSSQLYLVTALNLLYENTGQGHYEQEARSVLHFVCTRLRDGGRLVHHWIDGRRVRPDEPKYYCSGCNLQALYVMWYMSQLESGRN